MPTKIKNLQSLTEQLIEEVKDYGILDVSVPQYENVCRGIVSFARKSGEETYSADLMESFCKHLEERVKSNEICYGYQRFQERVVRMLSSLAETGTVDLSRRKSKTVKYPVPDEVSVLVEEILDGQSISDKTKSDLRAPVRHIFWYALERGIPYAEIGDKTIMEFMIEEIPVSNSGSTGRTLRCVKYVTEYLKSHGNKNIRHDYRLLTLRNDHRRIIPAFSEEEIASMSTSIDTGVPIGKRDYAIILLAYCTGLRGADILLLKLSDIDWRAQKIRICQSKTHAPITAELNGMTMNALADYVLDARPSCNVSEVFVTAYAPYRTLSGGFAAMIDKYCNKASVRKIPFRAFHSLRRSFETVMVSRGVAIETASQMMGHKTIGEEKPYITHDKSKAAFVAMDFTDVPIRAGIYAGTGSRCGLPEGGGV